MSEKRAKTIFRILTWVTVGIILTAIGARIAYHMRGYLDIGGEWLILPAVLIIRYEIGDIIREVKEVFGDGGISGGTQRDGGQGLPDE